MPETPQEWPSKSPIQEVVVNAGKRGLHLKGNLALELVLPGQYEPGAFTKAAIDLISGCEMTVRAGLRRPDGTTIGSLDTRLGKDGELERMEFDLRALAGEETGFSELILLFNRTKAGQKQLDLTILGVDLIDQPMERWLPTAGVDEAGLIDLEGEARRGFGLATGAPLTAQVSVPDGAPYLRLAHAPAPRSASPAGNPELVVRVDGKVLDRSRPLADWKGPVWTDVRIDLTPFAGKDVELALSLEGKGEQAALIALEQPVVARPGAGVPTVVLITSDTHRAGYLGKAGLGVEVRTPNLDLLAASGVFFEDCFASSNITLPSHVCLMTGLDPATTGVVNNRTRLADRAATLAEVYADAGYATIAVTSAKHMNDPWSGLGQGFDRYAWPLTDRARTAPETVEQTLAWLDEVEGEPVFVWCHLFDAHRPYEPPEELARSYFGDGDPFDPTLPEPPWPRPGNLRGVKDAAWVEALYRGEVSFLDLHVAKLLTQPRVRDGIVAFTSDHGEALGDQGIWWEHLGVYPAVLHVPLILSWPGAPAGRRVKRPVRQFDVGATLLALSGLSADAIGGEDLSPTWSGDEEAASPRFAIGTDGHAVSITSQGWHLVVNLRMPKAHMYTRDLPVDYPVELFYLPEDPLCHKPRTDAEDDRIRRLAPALVRWLEDAPVRLAEANLVTAEDAAMLAGLGYATGDDNGSKLIDLEDVRERLSPWLD